MSLKGSSKTLWFGLEQWRCHLLRGRTGRGSLCDGGGGPLESFVLGFFDLEIPVNHVNGDVG